MPLVSADCQFLAPAQHGDRCEVRSRIARFGGASFVVAHDVVRSDGTIARQGQREARVGPLRQRARHAAEGPANPRRRQDAVSRKVVQSARARAIIAPAEPNEPPGASFGRDARFLRIAASLTSSSPSTSAIAAVALDAAHTSSRSVNHWLCHWPRPRSCSGVSCPRSVAARPGARCAASSAEHAKRGVALVRHAGRAAAPGLGGLGRLSHFRLHQERYVATDLARDAGEDRELGAEPREAIARAVPGNKARRQLELLRERRHDRFAALAERRQRAARAAELQDAGIGRGAARAGEAARDHGEPHRCLPAEGHGQRRLQKGPRRRRRARVAPCELGCGIAEPDAELHHPRARRLETEDDRGIDDVLAGGAGVHMARRLGRDRSDLCGQLLHEGNGQRARAPCARQRRGVELRAIANARDGFCVRGGQETLARRGARQRAFEARHCRQQLRVGQEPGADLVREQELEAQKSKNTVSFLPCSTTFHSSAPSPRFFAISVARRSAGTRLSTGSSAFAGSSGK